MGEETPPEIGLFPFRQILLAEADQHDPAHAEPRRRDDVENLLGFAFKGTLLQCPRQRAVGRLVDILADRAKFVPIRYAQDERARLGQ